MQHIETYVRYIWDTSGVQMSIADFDAHWEDLGRIARYDMRREGMTTEADGVITLTKKAKRVTG